MSYQCADCKWGVAIYKRQYKGIVLGCKNPNPKMYQGLGCFEPKEEDSVDKPLAFIKVRGEK